MREGFTQSSEGRPSKEETFEKAWEELAPCPPVRKSAGSRACAKALGLEEFGAEEQRRLTRLDLGPGQFRWEKG